MTARRILITGVGRGLGRPMTEKFIELGHAVVGCSRQQAAFCGVEEAIWRTNRFDAVDVADDSAVGKWAKKVLADGGPPDLLLNNAAVVNENARLWEVPVDEFSRVIDVNIKGTYHVLRHFLPAMISRKSGVIVNFSSAGGDPHRRKSPGIARPNMRSKD